MQYLKDEIRKNILESAKNEFLQKGYKSASMRGIAKNAGVALGNVYRYFQSKDDLFNGITTPVHDEILRLVFFAKKPTDIPDNDLPIAHIIGNIMKIYEMYRKELIIIIEKSEGSKYQNVRDDLIKHLNVRLSEELLVKLKVVNAAIDSFFINVIASSIIEGAFIIFREYKDKKKIQDNMALLVKFYFNGVIERMKGENLGNIGI